MKRTVFTGLMVMLILSTAVTAQAAHTHKYTRQDSKVYVCECGKEKTLYSIKGERVVTLNCNGGSLYGGIYKTDITEAVTEQNKIKLPLPYKNSDYQFEGWFTESGEKVSSDTEYYSDTTLYAKWEEDKADNVTDDNNNQVSDIENPDTVDTNASEKTSEKDNHKKEYSTEIKKVTRKLKKGFEAADMHVDIII